MTNLFTTLSLTIGFLLSPVSDNMCDVNYQLDFKTKQVEIKKKDLICLAEVIYYESRGDTLVGKKAVADVVLNRVESNVFPDSICSVVYQRKPVQFSWTAHKYPIKEKDAWEDCKEIAREKLIRHYKGIRNDVTGGAMYFSTGYHHKGTKKIGKIGNHHVFFKP